MGNKVYSYVTKGFLILYQEAPLFLYSESYVEIHARILVGCLYHETCKSL